MYTKNILFVHLLFVVLCR